MSPIPPNKNDDFPIVDQNSGASNQPEEITIAQEEVGDGTWDPNFYNVNYNGVTYQQLNQEPPTNDDESSEEELECELTEIDPDIEFEILASTRTEETKPKNIEPIVHSFEKDFFEKKIELECEEIALDENKIKTINNLMANFKLPDASVPDWAKNVPEHLWKTNILNSLNAKKTDLFKIEPNQ